jgi:two-component system cell cycle sensor histidine kinase/response regulator CckA
MDPTDALFDALPIPGVRVRVDGESLALIAWNTAAYQLSGGRIAEADPTLSFVPEVIRAEMRGCARDREARARAVTYQGLDGTVRAFVASFVPGPDGVVTAVGLDRTEVEREQEFHRATEARYESIVGALDEGVMVFDRTGRVLSANAASERILGEQGLVGIDSPNRGSNVTADGRRMAPADYPIARVLRDGNAVRDVELEVARRDGTSRWMSVNAFPLRREPNEAPYAAVTTFVDITERRSAQLALRDSEARYRRIVQTSHDGIWTIDADGRTTFANGRMAAILGAAPEALASASVWAFVDAVDLAATEAALDLARTDARDIDELRLRRSDGAEAWVSLSVAPFVDADGRRGALMIVRDVTEARRVREDLGQTETRLAFALTAARMASWEWDVSTGRLVWASNLEAPFGGATPAEPWGPIHPEDRERVQAAIADGIARAGQRPALDLEYRILRDGAVGWIHARAVVFRDPIAGSTHIAGTTADATARKRLEDELFQSRKLESIGRLAGGIAHDFNNLLTTILGATSLAEASPERAVAELRAIRDAAERAAALTRQLLAFARRQPVALGPVDLTRVVDRMRGVLDRLLPPAIRLQTELEAAPWLVRADVAQCEQVVMNLVINARDAMPDGGIVRLVTRNTAITNDPEGELPAGEYAAIVVTDTGIGMDEATRRQVFEPFYTTRPGGTGLGLATVQAVARHSGGSVRVTSAPGAGSSFEVLLPRTAGTPVTRAQPAASAIRGTETVLLVDDEPLVLRTTALGLAALGYHVLSATDGVDALAIANAWPGPIHLLATDVMMPRLDGRGLAEQLRATRPEARVLFVSGYTDDAHVHGDGSAFLAKPYTGKQLAARLRALLDEPRKSEAGHAPADPPTR